MEGRQQRLYKCEREDRATVLERLPIRSGVSVETRKRKRMATLSSSSSSTACSLPAKKMRKAERDLVLHSQNMEDSDESG